jgi:dephospho-CoA kinase
VAQIIREAGIPVIDADRLAREALRAGEPAFFEALRHFGPGVVGADGEIDRPALARIVFSDPAARAALNAIVHPRVAQRMTQEIAALSESAPAPLVVLEVPLLFETGLDLELDGVLVVDVPEELQLARLMARDRLTRQEALARMAAQMPREERRRRASVLIDNSGAPGATRSAVLEALERLGRRMSGGAP